MNNLQNTIPNKLLEYRKKAGLTQLDVMLKLGFKSMDRVSRWERGLSYPSVGNLFKLAKIYQVQAGDLYPAFNIDDPEN